MAETPSRFRLSISMNVIENLGINLYSNVPAVLSEIVANAWDADATKVTIDWDHTLGMITIQDDGIGMTADEANDRFLTIGYRRREHQPGLTERKRKPMGRKGIGKLSLFAISDHIEVQTVSRGQKSAFLLDVEHIRRHIESKDREKAYELPELSAESIDFEHGTRLTLSSLRKRQSVATSAALRKRVARRFSMIGAAGEDFQVFIDGQEVTPADRDYYKSLEFIWTYGDQSDILALATKATQIPRPSLSVDGSELSGWIGTVKESGNLRDADGENLNRIAIFVRKKMAHEDILGDLSERGVYASYLIGDLKFDGLDLYDGEGTQKDSDAATSNRQKVVEDDPRYLELRNKLQAELKVIQNSWSKLRGEAGAAQAMQIPAVKEWIDGLQGDNKERAKQWVGKVNRIRVDGSDDRRSLIKHSVLAFEAHRMRNNLAKLESLDEHNLDKSLAILEEVDDLEKGLYGQIVKQRIDIVKSLRVMVEDNELERAIQKYVFDHLWLLDPSWDRVEGTEIMEARITTMINAEAANMPQEEKDARIDIKYRKSAGEHVVVELKKPDRRMRTTDLISQIGKYKSGMLRLLDTLGRSNERIEFVLILGRPPVEFEGPAANDFKDMLKSINARVLYYDQLLQGAEQAYIDYLQASRSANRLSRILAEIDDFVPALPEDDQDL